VVLLLVFVLLAASCVITLLPVPVKASTIVVPDDYPTIASAIGNATDGDTVFVRKGTYNLFNETLLINKSMQLIGEDRDTTIIDGNHFGNIIEVTANNVEISGFTIQNSGQNETAKSGLDTGIYVKTCTGTKIINNTIKNNIGGLNISSCSNILISENRILSNFHTPNIIISSSSSVTFSKNYVTNNTGETIVFSQCSDSIVTENQIVANGFDYGMYGGTRPWAVISISHGITVSMNNITGNALGLGLINSYGNNVFRNDMRGNGIGISLSTGATENRIYENNIQANSYGMLLHAGSNNRIYHNNFTSNTDQTSFWSPFSFNIWDNGAAGNYWSDYNGTDNNGDGIGDLPYVFNANNTDRYPLMSPSGTFPLPTPTPTPTPSPTATPTPSATPSPEPTPSLSPSPSQSPSAPTQEPTPSPEPEPQPEPFASTLVAASVASVAVIGLGLLLYFKKRER